MSDEEIRFKRSQGGHDANDLHNHGGQDAREDRTAREDLEDAIEELDEPEQVEVKTSKKIDVFDDDVELPIDPADVEPEVDPEDPYEEKKIAEAKKIEEAKAEEAIEEAIEEDAEAEATNDWKDKEENKAYMQIDSVEEPKAKTGAGWKVATILFALLAIAGCGAAAYLFLFDGTTKFLGREITSKVEGAKAPSAPAAPETPNSTPIAEAFDFDAKTIDYAGFQGLFTSKQSASPIKIDITKDGKYYYIIADVADGVGGWAGVWYRETTKGAKWTALQGGHSFPICDTVSSENRKFMLDYNYIDDDLNSQYIGCNERTVTN
ncbi:hypothetical protein IK110_03295 [Candidatus Saccharibacteria bacterium]|nr:hypothetical protein [Candidatus Saccharibacteria bacterium]